MKKITLIDGNSLMFRSYFATSYTGNLMQNKKGLYTNALFGFCNMLTKVLERDLEYIFVAFDAGKQTFRHQAYDEYKGGRKALPDELRVQIPYIKEYLDILNIKREESLEFEADDLIASVATLASNAGYAVEVITGDKDLLQLVNDNITVYLTKSGVKELEEYNVNNFFEKMGITPIQVTDYKGIVGDKSDNLPGVKGIGDKGASKLLQTYQTLENIYLHLNELTAKQQQLFTESKELALKCKFLATLKKDIELNFALEDLKYQEANEEKLISFFQEMEFESFLKKLSKKQITITVDTAHYQVIDSDENIFLQGESYIALEIFRSNYYQGEILGLALVNEKNSYFFTLNGLRVNKTIKQYLEGENPKKTFDLKRAYVGLRRLGITLNNVTFDLLLAGYLINPNYANDDFRTVLNHFCASSLAYTEDIYGANSKQHVPSENIYQNYGIEKCHYLKIVEEDVSNKINELHLNDLLHIEQQLAIVLGDMELTGLKVDVNRLDEIGQDLTLKAEDIASKIFQEVGETFNINSPKQLGEILFEKLHLPHGKKNKTGYSTSVDVLEKIASNYPIVQKILDYRAYTKIVNTYVKGLKEVTDAKGEIHPLYKQALTTTGRLSSVEPNIQNMPIRTEVGQTIREAFVSRFPDGVILSCDYSQIELRLLAHMSEDPTMIASFNSGVDFHTKTASDIFEVPLEMVTKEMRRMAKAINFGIIYGISAWGLSENIHISPLEANIFINKYFETYHKAKEYLDSLVTTTHQTGYTQTILLRRRYIEEINSDNANLRSFGERTAMNAPIQGSAADIIKLAMINVEKVLKEKQFKSLMVAQVHDELVFDCLKEESVEVARLVKETMENAYQLLVPLVSSSAIGKNWFEAK